ncbi:MAG: hypothetical protein KC466_20965 [Myxococcales bacterium]|nr:hypothetical protein [Myxococcales bacterium]
MNRLSSLLRRPRGAVLAVGLALALVGCQRAQRDDGPQDYRVVAFSDEHSTNRLKRYDATIVVGAWHDNVERLRFVIRRAVADLAHDEVKVRPGYDQRSYKPASSLPGSVDVVQLSVHEAEPAREGEEICTVHWINGRVDGYAIPEGAKDDRIDFVNGPIWIDWNGARLAGRLE